MTQPSLTFEEFLARIDLKDVEASYLAAAETWCDQAPHVDVVRLVAGLMHSVEAAVKLTHDLQEDLARLKTDILTLNTRMRQAERTLDRLDGQRRYV